MRNRGTTVLTAKLSAGASTSRCASFTSFASTAQCARERPALHYARAGGRAMPRAPRARQAAAARARAPDARHSSTPVTVSISN